MQAIIATTEIIEISTLKMLSNQSLEKNLSGPFNDSNLVDLEAGANRCAIS